MSDDLAIGEVQAHRLPLPPAGSSRVVRIFISSPGDVVEEREQARRVIEGLQRQYPGASLRPVLWEDLALPATATFQEGIDYVLTKQPIDIAVFVLWSRLGTPLGPAVTRPDGEPYRSGTERELDLMLAAFEQSGHKHPLILAYARDDDAGFKRRLVEAPNSALEDLVEQQKLAEQFIREHFRDAQGHNLRAYHSYREPIGFAQRLRAHLREALDGLLEADAAPRWLDEPYRALQVFDVAHAAIFHGRDEETCDLLQRLRDQQHAGCEFVVIVGCSGSGKSSLARAGVAASLVQSSVDDGVKQWRAAFFVPALEAEDLFGRLAHVLAEAIPGFDGSPSILADLAAGLKQDAPLAVRLSLNPAFARAAEHAGGPVRVLLVLDPLEELWTDRRITPADRELFFRVIEALATSGHVAVLATLRSDFYPQAQQQLARLKHERGHYDLFAPDAAALARLIREPARLAGLAFERQEQTGRTLDEIILQDAARDTTARDTTALPLLEYALSELYRRRDEQRRLLTFAAYQAMGGVEGALGTRAEEVFESLPETACAALDEIVPLLVTVDTEGEQAAVRRRACQANLTSTPARQALFQALTAARFLTTDREGDRPVASLAHEALLRRWKRIACWIATNREHLRLRARVEQAQHRWEQENCDDSLLLPPGLALEEARQLLRGGPHLLAPATADYIRASIALDARRKQQTRRRRRTLTSVLSILTLLATCAALLAWNKQREAQQQRGIADQQRDNARAAEAHLGVANMRLSEQLHRAASSIMEWAVIENLNGRSDRALALFAGARTTAPPDDPLRGGAANLAAGCRQQAPASLRHGGPGNAVAFSPDGRMLATAGFDNTARLWDVATGKPCGEPLRHDGPVWGVAFSPDGRTLATASEDKTARLWDVATGKPRGEPLLHGYDVDAVAFSPDGRTLATRSGKLGDAGAARLWDVTTGMPRGELLRHDRSPVSAVAFSPDGRTLATAGWDGAARLWDAAAGKPRGEPLQNDGAVQAVAFSPDGRTLATASWDKTARLWNVASGKPRGEPLRHDGMVHAVAFSPDGRTLATASGKFGDPGAARLWDVATGKPLGEPLRHDDTVYGVAFSRDGRTLATGSFDKTARLWDVATGTQSGEPLRHDDRVETVAFSPDGRTLATASPDGTARLWGVATGTRRGEPPRHDDRVVAAAFSPDGRTLATASYDKAARLWDVATAEPRGEPLRHGDRVVAVAFSPDGRTLATASEGKAARLWDVATGKPRGEPLRHDGAVRAVAISPDGRTLVTASGETARFWDVASGKPRGDPLRHDGWVRAVAFSSDGRTVATASDDRTARLWDVASGKPRGEPLRHDGAVYAVAFSPDGRTLATASGRPWSSSGASMLWDVATGKPRGEPLRHDGDVNAVAFSPDARTLATASEDKTALLWDVASGKPRGEPLRHDGAVRAVAFSPDGRTLATASDDTTARLWELPADVPDELLDDYAAVHSGWLVDSTGLFRPLSVDEADARWKSLEANGGEWLAAEAKRFEEGTYWFHRYEADAAERVGSWFAAAFHLGKLLERSPDDAELRARHERALANLREAAASPPASSPAAPMVPVR